ncbi:uncharacterized protein LOC133182410 isoform X2 [Saccostrea echinata]|uniref:uncharacterized protein LOC133182410 isoform X2 n=1 Tax=Saccostrea echinata TaxID=191078 RepID=UPI002A7ECF39|nr:uncharacterized protein LOC133182410 isoform X2 [Saccostrea echinata]
MGLAEAFSLYGNFQAGFGLVTVIWTIGLTKGESLVYVPVIQGLMNTTFLSPLPSQNDTFCLITTPAMSHNGSSGVANMSLLSSELVQRDLLTTLNGSSGGVMWKNNFEHLYLVQKMGDITPLYEFVDGVYSYLVPIKVFNETRICLYSGFSSVTYEIYVINSTLDPESFIFKDQQELHSFSSHCFFYNSTDSDIILVNSSKAFGVLIMESETLQSCCPYRALEAIPNIMSAGTEFVLVTEEDSEILMMGIENSDINVKTTEEEFNFTVTSNTVKKLNVSGNLTLQLTSSKPIQVMCLTNVQNGENSSFLNLFTLFPVVPIFCNWLEISSSCFDEPCLIVLTKKTSVFPSISINGWLVMAKNYSFGNYNVQEITNLRKGQYFLQITDSAGFAVFVLNRDLGRLYQVQPLNKNQCSVIHSSLPSLHSSTAIHSEIESENTTNSNVTTAFRVSKTLTHFSSNHSVTSSNSSDENSTSLFVTLILNTTTEKSAFVNVTLSSVNATNTTILTTDSSKYGRQDKEMEIGGLAFQSQTNQNTSNEGAPSYNIFLQDAEEDDNSQEYMIAVILSLCVAIFAVIAVISSFLLMEFISRQKQIRNTKIRPFVS